MSEGELSQHLWMCQCGGWVQGSVCVFVCQINYLNPPTIKAEICYQRPPLEARVSALLPQYALRLFPLSVLSVGPDKDHKLWILNTHPGRTKANDAPVTWGLMNTHRNVFITGANEYFFWWWFFLMQNVENMSQESVGVFNLHDFVVVNLRWFACVWSVTWDWSVWSVSGESFVAVHDGMSVRVLSCGFTPCASLSLTFTASFLSSVSLFPPWRPFSPSFHFTSPPFHVDFLLL